MHIPDGYLSPSTCAVLYAGAAPFWYVALERVRRTLSARLVPMISVCAAFSFVVMMFNLPLPCGTTGHAVGVTVATVVLGPWASMLAISVALFIQAVFFGDGGVTAFGANCLNMAIVGSLVSHAVYSAIAGRSASGSSRKVVGAVLAGYAALNAAALCAAVEFGIQPALFHDAAGTPLYAPYPLSIALPGMMLGHLTIAGLAEAVLSGGVVAWLQHSNPVLLHCGTRVEVDGVAVSGWRAVRPLLCALAGLLVATPLGLLAAGTAWGEWDADAFKDPVRRAEIAAASAQVAPPVNAPTGMERLAGIWTAPFPEYAPSFIKSAGFGYLLSGMLGVGALIATGLGIDQVVRRSPAKPDSEA